LQALDGHDGNLWAWHKFFRELPFAAYGQASIHAKVIHVLQRAFLFSYGTGEAIRLAEQAVKPYLEATVVEPPESVLQ